MTWVKILLFFQSPLSRFRRGRKTCSRDIEYSEKFDTVGTPICHPRFDSQNLSIYILYIINNNSCRTCLTGHFPPFFHFSKPTEVACIMRYRRKRPKVDASIFYSALSRTRRSDASKKQENSVSTFWPFRMWTSLESSPVSVNELTIGLLTANIWSILTTDLC